MDVKGIGGRPPGPRGRAAAAGPAPALLIAAVAAAALLAPQAHAEVSVPDGTVAGLRGAGGTYYVIGVAANSGEAPSGALVTVTVDDGGRLLERTVDAGTVPPGGEVPFKVAFPEARSASPSPAASASPIPPRGPAPGPAEVVYDATLSMLPGGGISGWVENPGPAPSRAGMLLAVAHGPAHEPLDVASVPLPAGAVQPGGRMQFEMRPDPSVAGLVRYYSCFAIGDPAVLVLNAKRGGETFTVRYESGILFAYPEFDGSGTELSLFVSPGWPGQTAAVFEVPMRSAYEEIGVEFDGEPVEHIQSVGETGNWHVSFEIGEQSQGWLSLTGLDPSPLVPAGLREAAGRWAAGGPADGLAAGLAQLAARGLLPAGAGGEQRPPEWARAPAGWWAEGLVSDREFLAAMRHVLRTPG